MVNPARASLVVLPLLVACAQSTTTGKVAPSTPAPLPTEAPSALFAGQPVEVIAEEARYAFAEDGRKVFTYRLTYRVLGTAALEKWATISADWTPWYQDRPELSAKVTTRAGETFQLDAKSIAEVPAGSGDDNLYSDRRRLVAPLPGLEVGALVEQKTVLRDRRPFFGEGSVGRFYFGMGVPVFLSRVVLEAPEDVPLAWSVRGIDIEPDEDVEDGRRVVTFETGPVLPQGAFEPHLPTEVPRYPYVAFSTAGSWQHVAARYAALVERQLLGADVSKLVEGVPSGAGRDVKIRTLVDRLHRRVRYTGIEFGRQAIVPWTPKETLARGYGDCKDKSALLVAMLREVGIEAHIAILKAGFGEDALLELPGLEAFNHAIVYVPGEVPLWIDATAHLTPVGEIPTTVQGRLALVASPSTSELVEIPTHPMGHASYVEQRTIVVAPWGPARIVERTSGTGAMQDKLRAQYSAAPPRAIRGALEKYVRATYKARDLDRFEMTGPLDLSTPFVVEIEAEEAHVAVTDEREANVQLRTAVLFSWLPEELRMAALAERDEKDDERRIAAEQMLGREDDFVFYDPYVAELRYVVMIPEGFELTSRPEDRRYGLGPGAFTTHYQELPDRIVATFRIDLAKRRYAPDELRAFVVGLYEVFDSPVERISLQHRGARLLAEGKTKEAIAHYQALIAAHPDDAFHHARFADALLELGLGAAARRAIDEGLRHAPYAAPMYRVAGRVYSHDLFGRRFGAGYDRYRAIDSYRRALAIAPGDHEARFSLAVLLEHDERGVRYGDKKGTKEAVDLYRELPSGDGYPNHTNNLLIALHEAQDYEGLEEATEVSPRSELRDMLMVVAVTINQGVEAGHRALESLRLPPNVSQKIAEDAATALAHKRHYDEARMFLERVARTAQDPIAMQQRLATLARLRRYEPGAGEPKTPVEVVERVLAAMFAPTLDRAAIRGLFVELGSEDAIDAEVERLTMGFSAFRNASVSSGLPAEMMRDNVIAMTKFFVEGDDRIGYRVGGRVVGSKGQRTTWWFVVKEKGRYRLRATEASLGSVGEEALHLLVRKNERGARKWLDWAKEIAPHPPGGDVLSENPFLALWSGGDGPVRLSAAALQATGGRGEKVVDILTAERKRHNAPEVRTQIDHALLLALADSDRHAERLEIAARLYRQHARSWIAFDLYCGALVDAHQEKKAVRLLQARIDERPRDPVARARLADTFLKIGAMRRAEGVLRDSVRLGVASPTTYNNLAWLQLFDGRVTDEDVDLAVEANTMTSFENPSHLHTLAALYAEVGKSAEAMQLVVRRMTMAGQEAPTSADWYLLGRVMESYGLFSLAREAYEKVENDEDREADSTWALARMKLRGLGRRAPKERI